MDELSPPEAMSVSAGVQYLPFGIPGLDGAVRGIPTGSAVLLAGAPDAGGHGFLYTSLASLMLAKHDPALYPRRIGDAREAIPERVCYVSLTHDREHIYSELDAVLDTEQFATLAEHLTVADFSQQFLEAVDVPEPLYGQRREDLEPPTEDGDDGTGDDETGDDNIASLLDDIDFPDERDDDVIGDADVTDLLDEVSDYVADHGDDAILVIDGLSDLLLATNFGLDRSDVLGFLLGVREATVGWDGVTYVLYERRAADVRGDPDIHGLLHGSVFFYSNDQGHDTYRTMRVGSFGGALDTERQTVFETSVGPAGVRAKATKKIGPSNW
jgi:KaiC/GvpD/RAD55 family RecA-like ATPase